MQVWPIKLKLKPQEVNDAPGWEYFSNLMRDIKYLQDDTYLASKPSMVAKWNTEETTKCHRVFIWTMDLYKAIC